MQAKSKWLEALVKQHKNLKIAIAEKKVLIKTKTKERDASAKLQARFDKEVVEAQSELDVLKQKVIEAQTVLNKAKSDLKAAKTKKVDDEKAAASIARDLEKAKRFETVKTGNSRPFLVEMQRLEKKQVLRIFQNFQCEKFVWGKVI